MKSAHHPRRPNASPSAVTVMDTTLRDGEQTPNVAFAVEDKLDIARLLLCKARVDRIEVGSARVSPGEQRAAREVAALAASEGLPERVELLGFCDGHRSVDWICEAGVGQMNLLAKGSERHCRLGLGLGLTEHVAAIQRTLEAAARAQLSVSGVYLEDWSRGVADSPEYVVSLVRSLEALGVRRVYLADTLGVLDPPAVTRHVRRMCRSFPRLRFEFHGHDDYGLASANALAAVRAGASGLHATVNGLGERAGNADLSQLVVLLRDHAGCGTAVVEAHLPELSERVARASGCPLPHNAPIVGEHVFTHTAGVHADGDAKGDLYVSRLTAERFGRRRGYALGKLSGRASLVHHLGELGLELGPSALEALLDAVVRRGDEKRRIDRADLLELIELLALEPRA